MLIRFLKDFRSAATGENFYEAGAVVDLLQGSVIVAEGAAEIVTIDSRRGQAQPKEEEAPSRKEEKPVEPVKRGR